MPSTSPSRNSIKVRKNQIEKKTFFWAGPGVKLVLETYRLEQLASIQRTPAFFAALLIEELDIAVDPHLGHTTAPALMIAAHSDRTSRQPFGAAFIVFLSCCCFIIPAGWM
jgi:hypothetical protein